MPAADPRNLLPPAPDDPSVRDLGKNGSYLVFRHLRQDVHGFWRCLAEKAPGKLPGDAVQSSVALASKMVGRWPSGAPLVKSPAADDPALADDNDFMYFGSGDPDGLKCPIGSHIRRSNPRDALDPRPGSDRSIEVGKRHRILRRGRAYGPPVAASMEPADIMAKPDDRARTRPLLHLLQHPARPAVRVRPKHLAQQPQVRRALRRRRSDRGRPGRRRGEARAAPSPSSRSPCASASPACPASSPFSAEAISSCPGSARFATWPR